MDTPYNLPLPTLFANLRDEVAALDRRALAATQGLSPQELDRQSGPKKWSVAQCLQHLILFDTAYFVGVEERVKALPAVEAEDRFSLRGFDKWAFGFFGDQPSIRIPTSGMFDPKFNRTYGATILARYRDHLERLDQLFRLSAERDVNLLRLTSPATSLVSFPYPAISMIAVAHHRRHLGQAERTRATLGL
jgi:hypothetical protein